MPMHVGGLQLFEKPEGAGRDYAREIYEQMPDVDEIAPLFLKRPHRVGSRTAGQWAWTQDDKFDIEYHFRHSALPKPGRVRELLELCSRLHGTRLARERPLWEAHLIEGLRDGRVALYTKMHHSLVDGISAMRLLQSVMTHRPRQARHAADVGGPPAGQDREGREEAEHSLADVPLDAMRTALGITADAAGLPGALVKTLTRGPEQRDLGAVALRAAHDVQHHDHRLAPLRRPGLADRAARAIGKASGTTLNDVVLAMCSGAMRTYLIEHDALPDTALVSMVPVGLNAKQSQSASGEGGNAVGAVMVKLGTELARPGRPARPRSTGRCRPARRRSAR